MEEDRSHAHSVSSCKYHFVCYPKYRHPVLNVVEDDVRELFDETSDHFGTKFWRWRLQTTTYTCSSSATQNTVQPTSPGSSSRTRVSTCWSGIPRFRSRISGVADSGRLGTTWERQLRCRRKWLNGISKRRNTRRSDALHPRPRWAGNSRCFS
jgi:hypothetical protein